jgi:rubrerythrin
MTFETDSKFGIEPPQDTWPERVTAPATLAEACRAGVEAEIENQAMYERLLKEINEPQTLAVMQRLQRASQERHLPAFQRCLERESDGRGHLGEQPRRMRTRRRGS